MLLWEMWDFNLLCSELESVFSATHCLRVQQVAAPTSSSSGRRAVPHVCVWPLPLGHRPAVFAIFSSTPDHLRWAINLHLLHLLDRRLALPFLQVVQGVVTIWDLEKWCKNQSKSLQPQGRGGSLGAFSCLVLSELVNRVAVDLTVRVAGQVAGARHVCSEYRGLKKKAGGVNKKGSQLQTFWSSVNPRFCPLYPSGVRSTEPSPPGGSRWSGVWLHLPLCH